MILSRKIIHGKVVAGCTISYGIGQVCHVTIEEFNSYWDNCYGGDWRRCINYPMAEAR